MVLPFPNLSAIEPMPYDRIEMMNAAPGTLKGADCPICRNKGFVFYLSADGYEMARECECMKARQSLRSIKQSGLDGLMQIYRMDNFTTDTEWTKGAKRVAEEYIKNGKDKWFYICGVPGSGKTHLCTAICGELIQRNKKVLYVVWRGLVQKLKSLVNDPQYEEEMRKLRGADVLYIDDFLKGTITDADLNRAFEIINDRYNAVGTRTIISSERSIVDIRSYDEATGSRIYQRAKGYILKTPSVNWRDKE